MTTMTQDNVASIAKSILNHARAIHRYAKSYCEGDTSDFMNDHERAKSRLHVEEMLRELQTILTMARRKGISELCNLEQVAAYANAARDIIGRRTANASVYRPEVAMWN